MTKRNKINKKEKPIFFSYKGSKRDFIVDEILPQGIPSGEGKHLYIKITKHNQTTQELKEHIARICGVPHRIIGIGGKKDKIAYTSQRFSIPKNVIENIGGKLSFLKLIQTKYQLSEASRHSVSLRLGSIAGNKFQIKLRNERESKDMLFRELMKKSIDRIIKDGFPNYYGEQRFGLNNRNPELGKKILLGSHKNNIEAKTWSKNTLGGTYKNEAARKIQALSSKLFNIYIRKRRAMNVYDKLLVGDVLIRKADGSQIIYDKDKITLKGTVSPHAITGPVFGYDIMMAYVGKNLNKIENTENIQSLGLEIATLQSYGLSVKDIDRFKRYKIYGIRRPIRAFVDKMEYRFVKNSSDIYLTFMLGPGIYATSMFAEIRRLMHYYSRKKG